MFGEKEGASRPLDDFATEVGTQAGSARRHRAGSAPSAEEDPPAPRTLPLSAEIERLYGLLKRHIMTDGEFTAAKAAVIAGTGSHGFSPSPDAQARRPSFARSLFPHEGDTVVTVVLRYYGG